MIEVEPLPTAINVPDLRPETFTLDNVDFEEPGNQHMINLCNPPFALEPEVMKDCPVRIIFEMKIDMVTRSRDGNDKPWRG
jgi:hypothetical protein